MKIHTQAELSANIDSKEILEIVAAGVFAVTLTGTQAPSIFIGAGVTLDVECRESSQPRVVCRESSQPRVVCRGSSQPRVECWESSQPRVEAQGYSQCSFFGRISAKCGPNVSALIAGPATVEGGKQTVIDITTPRAWCDYYGVAVSGEIATLFKAVGADGKSPRGTDYSPGLIPTADDWDGGARECGGGLHYSPTPAMARSFFDNAKRYMACPVALSDIAVHPDGQYPEKCKARGCCAPTYEVDEDGVPLLPQTVSEVTP